MQDGFGAGEEFQDPHSAHGLTEHRGDGCAPHAQPEPEDEDGVQNDVDHGTDHGGEHTGFGKALRGDKGIHAQHQQHEHRAEKINAAVAQRIRQGCVAGTEQPQQPRCPGVEPHRQHDREGQQHRKAVGNDLFGLLPVPLPHGDGSPGRAAGTHQHGKGIQKHQNGGEQSHAGQRRRADAHNMADVNAVHNVVQQVHNLCHDSRDHQLQHQLFHVSCAHILSCLRHWKNLLLLQI